MLYTMPAGEELKNLEAIHFPWPNGEDPGVFISKILGLEGDCNLASPSLVNCIFTCPGKGLRKKRNEPWM